MAKVYSITGAVAALANDPGLLEDWLRGEVKPEVACPLAVALNTETTTVRNWENSWFSRNGGGEGGGGVQFRHSRLRISRINQEGWHVFEVCMFRPICQLVSRFANCSAQSAYYPGICLICKLCQPISFHNMKLSNVGRQQSKILTIVISVTIFHKRQLLLMLVSCHSLCRISTFSTRYFSRSH